MNRTEIINRLINFINGKKYLEIGTGNCINFDLIQCNIKLGVDPNPVKNYILSMTSDEFFKKNKENFDIIFIDGLHYQEQVYKDIINSLAILNNNGYIICHDMNPTNEKMQLIPMQVGEWTGDCWKTWVKLKNERDDLNMFVVDTDYGCGIITKGTQEKIIINDILNWNNFNIHKKEWLSLISIDDFKKIIL